MIYLSTCDTRYLVNLEIGNNLGLDLPTPYVEWGSRSLLITYVGNIIVCILSMMYPQINIWITPFVETAGSQITFYGPLERSIQI